MSDSRDILLAQLRHTEAMLQDYVAVDTRGYGEGQMPHEWGSLDSLDYMTSALELSQAMLFEVSNGNLDNFLAHLGETVESSIPGDTARRIEMDYACDGVCPEIYEYLGVTS